MSLCHSMFICQNANIFKGDCTGGTASKVFPHLCNIGATGFYMFIESCFYTSTSFANIHLTTTTFDFIYNSTLKMFRLKVFKFKLIIQSHKAMRKNYAYSPALNLVQA